MSRQTAIKRRLFIDWAELQQTRNARKPEDEPKDVMWIRFHMNYLPQKTFQVWWCPEKTPPTKGDANDTLNSVPPFSPLGSPSPYSPSHQGGLID